LLKLEEADFTQNENSTKLSYTIYSYIMKGVFFVVRTKLQGSLQRLYNKP